MSFRRRLFSNPSSSRGWNKVRVTNKHDAIEIEPCFGFVSRNESNNKVNIRSFVINKKRESKESVYATFEKWGRYT